MIPRLARLTLSAAAAVTALLAASCGGPAPEAAQAGDGSVVLYSSVDGPVLDELIAAFTAETGIVVKVVGDTEATKTTGLVERVLAERARPAGHVWWSSEPFGSIRLAQARALDPFVPAAASAFGGAWPAGLTGGEGRWHGFGERARVIAYHREVVPEAGAPRTLAALTEPAWRGRVGMARPQFGTTRGHMAALHTAWGPLGFADWLEAMRGNGLRLYDGNAAVVQAIRNGEIDVGLTDSDDVWHAQRNGWPIGMVFEAVDPAAIPPSMGPLMLPNTAGLIATPPGTTRPPGAERLLNWILSERCEAVLARSDSRNIPVFPGVMAEHPDLAIAEAWRPDLAEVASHVSEALAVAERILP